MNYDYDIRINNNFFQDIIKYEESGELKMAKIAREKEKEKEKKK